MRYHDLDLIMSDGPPGAWPLYARGPGARSASGTLQLDPAAGDLSEALTRIRERRTDARFLVEFGRELYTRLFSGSIGALFDSCYEEARAQPATGLRLRLAINPAPLAALPWEFLYHPREKAFLASLVRCPVVRFLQDERRARSLLAPTPLRMLVCISELPPPWPRLDAARERADLEQALGDLIDDRVRLDFVQGAVTEDDLVDALGREYDCFHFIGHGDFVDGKGRLLLCGGDRDVVALDDDAVAALFRDATALKLAFLNACKGATRSGTDLAAGLGPRLVDAGLPAVVAMQYAVQDRAAVIFAREFYRSLFRGDNRGLVDYAVARARGRLVRHFAADRDLATPVLFLRAEDGLVFDFPVREPLWRSTRIDALDRAEHAARALGREAETLDENDPRSHAVRAREQAARRELRRLRRAGLSATLGLGIALIALWAAALDRLDLGFERLTANVGHSLLAAPLADAVRLVVVTPELEQQTGSHVGAAWRSRHAELVRRLAAAGARTVAFDMAFHEPVDLDRGLADAIRAAAQREPPMDVILGYTEMFDNVPHVPRALARSGARFAVTCYARSAGGEWARSLPLTVRKRIGTVWEALPLAAFAAYEGLTLAHGELSAGGTRQLLLHDAIGRRSKGVPYSHRADGSADSTCAAITAGDTTTELLLTNPPLATLRDPQHRIDYRTVLDADPAALAQQVRDRLVLVGAAVERDSALTAAGDRRFGFELHASAINDLLLGRALARAGRPWQLALLVAMTIAGAAAALLGGAAHPWRGRLVLAAAVVGYLLLALVVLATSLRMLDGVYHLGALLLAYWLGARGARRSTRTGPRAGPMAAPAPPSGVAS